MEPWPDDKPARWLIDVMVDFAVDVGSVVPRGFDAYARIFHPAYLGDREVTWAEVAEANERVVHPLMQWPGVTGQAPYSHDGQRGIWDVHPGNRSIPREKLAVLGTVLKAHTGAPDTIWFGVWDGYGDPQPLTLGRNGWLKRARALRRARRLRELRPRRAAGRG